MVLTVVHHAYGAVTYDEPFRLHVAIIAVPVIAILLISYSAYLKISNLMWRKTLLTIFLAVTCLFSIAAIGFYEGGYNHVVKNLLYFGGMPVDILNRMYPSIYELPNNFVFELTGVMQFVSGFLCFIQLIQSPVRAWLIFSRDPR
jgi:hypothetical protein